MFCPTGPAVSLVQSSGSLVFSGSNKNDRVLFVNFNGLGNVELTFNSSSAVISNFKLYAIGETLIRIPSDSTDVFVTVSGATGAACSAVEGEDA